MREDPAYALALDSYGTLAVEALAAAACRVLERVAARRGVSTSMPLSPGLNGWPLADGQRQVFALLGTRPAGITLTSSSQMLPRKSTTLVIGLGSGLTQQGRPCDYCSLQPSCRYQEHYA